MADVFDYLRWRGDLSFAQSEFCEVDGMILSRLSYSPFEYAFSDGRDVLTVSEAAEAILSRPNIENEVLQEEDLRLLRELSHSERFATLAVKYYVNQLDQQRQAQFSAVCVQLDADSCLVSFRGTDNTLIGWKEDFNMGFECPVPAQRLAVQYLERAAAGMKGEIIVVGHSKGGNLAVYAGAFCAPAVKKRILTVYNYDGPGFDEKILRTDEYKSICERVRTFVPQSSIVGMLLGHEEEYTIVHSTRVSGFLQHDIYSWEIERNRFVYLETVNNSSRFVDYTLKEWVANMDYEQREKLVDTLYLIITETNAHTLREMSDNWFASAKAVLRSVKNLDEPTRKAVTGTLVLLLKSAKKSMLQIMQSR